VGEEKRGRERGGGDEGEEMRGNIVYERQAR
jgi:hypothetical protein